MGRRRRKSRMGAICIRTLVLTKYTRTENPHNYEKDVTKIIILES